MRSIKKSFLCLLLGFGVQTFADDIRFIEPMRGFSISGKTRIQIEAPSDNSKVMVSLKSLGRSRMIVWKAELSASNRYTITLNADRLPEGRYELLAEYSSAGRSYKGRINLSVSKNSSSDEGHYFPEM
ncbi:MAG: hypothetical protein ACRCS8_02595 [Brevinema sp.]